MIRKSTSARRGHEKTPTERLFESFHVGIQKQWNREAFYRLCNKLNFTENELAALIGLKNPQLRACLKFNKFPVPVCRHFHNINRFTDMKRGIKLEPDPLDPYIK